VPPVQNGFLETRRALVTFLLLLPVMPAAPAASAQQPDAAAIIRQVDAAVEKRVNSVLGFTNVEHYLVYRGKDETHPLAELTARVTYQKGKGKSYTVLSESGSAVVRRFGLHPLLDNEKLVNQPGRVERSWFTSANYAMQLKPGGVQRVNGRDCYALAIVPRQKAPNMIDGTLWVDAREGFLVQVEGVASKSPSPFAGTTHMMRQYSPVAGFPMATRARAESVSPLFGRTVVVIDYSDYHLQLAASR
jgi:outer membrane lipoprotein-sorting protein